MDTVALDQAVAAHLPGSFLSSVVRSIFLARKDAHDHCAAEFALSEQKNVMPAYWRGKVQGLLRRNAVRFGGRRGLQEVPGGEPAILLRS
jgi:hypothetical protein